MNSSLHQHPCMKNQRCHLNSNPSRMIGQRKTIVHCPDSQTSIIPHFKEFQISAYFARIFRQSYLKSLTSLVHYFPNKQIQIKIFEKQSVNTFIIQPLSITASRHVALFHFYHKSFQYIWSSRQEESTGNIFLLRPWCTRLSCKPKSNT